STPFWKSALQQTPELPIRNEIIRIDVKVYLCIPYVLTRNEMGGNREESLSLVSYPISIKYNRRFDNFSVFLLWSLESRDFRSRVVMSVK
mgnify:CR=1